MLGRVLASVTLAFALVVASRGGADDGGVSLGQFALAAEVVERRPVDPGEVFSRQEVERIYAYLDVRNPGREPVTLTVHWARSDGSDRFEPTEVEIPGHRRWRTWAYTAPSRLGTGSHVCLVRTPEGRVIGRKAFRVTD